eukprot:3731850-Pleurochrysis_carterae.AAC.1
MSFLLFSRFLSTDTSACMRDSAKAYVSYAITHARAGVARAHTHSPHRTCTDGPGFCVFTYASRSCACPPPLLHHSLLNAHTHVRTCTRMRRGASLQTSRPGLTLLQQLRSHCATASQRASTAAESVVARNTRPGGRADSPSGLKARVTVAAQDELDWMGDWMGTGLRKA